MKKMSTILVRGFHELRLRALIAASILMLVACSGIRELTETERQKLDPQLTMLLRGDAIAESDFDLGIRKDGTREYGVIIRSKDVEGIKRAGIQVGSSFSDVITARVTIPELRKILGLESVRAVQSSSKNRPQ
jgi:hypothetical protein